MRPSFRNLDTKREDVTKCVHVPGRDSKSRFGVFQCPDVERVRASQGHSSDVTPPLANSLPREQHYLLHATSLRATSSILRGGFLTPPPGRKEGNSFFGVFLYRPAGSIFEQFGGAPRCVDFDR